MITFFEITGMLFYIGILYFIMNYYYNHKMIAEDKRIALDYLPFPIFFGLGNRLPLVVNDKMYELIYNLQGKPLTDTNSDFDCLKRYRLNDDAIDEDLAKQYENAFFISFNSKIYCVEEKLFADMNKKYIQINAHDITDEYDNLKRLRELNSDLEKQNERLRTYIENSIEINHQLELLDAKINIHGKFGDCLAMTRHLLKNNDDKSLQKKINGLWQQIVVGFSEAPEKTGISQKGYEELQRVADLVGCNLIIKGTLPSGETKAIMLKFLREALNNAIRHGNASSLTVDMQAFHEDGIVVVYDDGKPLKTYNGMGGGLSSLKKMLEKNGIIMNINSDNDFRIVLNFPESLRE